MRKILSFLLVAVAAVAVGACGNSKTKDLSSSVTSSPGDGAKSDSLFHGSQLQKALDALSKKDSKALMVKVEPNSIKAFTVRPGNKVTTIVVTKKLNVNDIGAVGDFTGNAFPLSKVQAGAPEKMLANVGKGLGLKDVNYFLVQSFSGAPKLYMYTYNKGYFQANLDGSGAKPLGSPSTSGGGSNSGGNSSSGGGSTPDPSKLQDCISKAGTDAAKIQACATGG